MPKALIQSLLQNIGGMSMHVMYRHMLDMFCIHGIHSVKQIFNEKYQRPYIMSLKIPKSAERRGGGRPPKSSYVLSVLQYKSHRTGPQNVQLECTHSRNAPIPWSKGKHSLTIKAPRYTSSSHHSDSTFSRPWPYLKLLINPIHRGCLYQTFSWKATEMLTRSYRWRTYRAIF